LIAPIRSRMEGLGQRLAHLKQPTSARAVEDLIARTRSTEADARTWRQIDAVLATPLPRAKDRPALWAAGRDLERRLREPILGTEPDEADRRASGPAAGPGEATRTPSTAAASRRAARSIALLHLAGLNSRRLDDLEKGHMRVEGGADWPELGQ